MDLALLAECSHGGMADADVAGGRVLGVLKDEMDVESVAVFEVTIGPLPMP